MTRRDDLALAVVGVVVGLILFAVVTVVLDVAWWRTVIAVALAGAGSRCFTEAAIAARDWWRARP